MEGWNSEVLRDCSCFHPEWEVGNGAASDLHSGPEERRVQAGGTLERSWRPVTRSKVSASPGMLAQPRHRMRSSFIDSNFH